MSNFIEKILMELFSKIKIREYILFCIIFYAVGFEGLIFLVQLKNNMYIIKKGSQVTVLFGCNWHENKLYLLLKYKRLNKRTNRLEYSTHTKEL